MKLEHTSKDKFVHQFAKQVKGLDLNEDSGIEIIAKAVWAYGNEEWSKGYAHGVRNLAKEQEPLK